MKQLLNINFTKTGLHIVRTALKTLPMNQVEDLLKDIDAQALPQLRQMKEDIDNLTRVDAAQGGEVTKKREKVKTPKKVPAKKVVEKKKKK